METILGIDLGTTNSEVSVIRDKEVIVIEKDGQKLLPSVVGIDQAGKLLVGHAARNQAILYPERTIKSIKRQMGEDVRITLGDRDYTPPEISAMILRTLRVRAEEFLSEPITKAVITVPAFFNDTQREATRLAGELAGLEVVRIINEPTAASFMYGGDEKQDETLLVYDLGGGTFDVSIVRFEDGVLEVLASHGDTHLGGDDFDQLLFDHVCNAFKKKNKIDLRDTPTAVSRTLQAVEEAKKALSTAPFVTIKEEFIVEKEGVPLHLDMEISRSDYEEMIQPLLEKTIACLNDALHDAKLLPSDIDKVILVGGASRTPLVHQVIEEQMAMVPHGEIDPDLCVTMGAAVQGGIIAGSEIGKVLVDITPHTLGISVLDHVTRSPYRFAALIKRNTPIPCSRSEVFVTTYDYQKEVKIEVYQGESEDTRLNVMIGEFLLSGLSEVPQGNEIVCRFDLDINGILHVSATEKKTGLQDNLIVENALEERKQEENDQFKQHLESFFDKLDADAMVADGEDADDEDGEDVEFAGISLRNSDWIEQGWKDAHSRELEVIRRAMTIAPNLSGDDSQEVEKIIKKTISAMKNKNENEVVAAGGQLEDLLYYLEDSQ